MSHWEECRKVAEGASTEASTVSSAEPLGEVYDWLFSVIFARDHLEALLRTKPEMEAKLEPIVAQLNELILGAEKLA